MRWGLRRRRRAARVVLLDPDDRVLLLRLDAAHDPEGRGCWYLPGGGVFPFEPIEAAARRELAEETGIRDAVLGPVLGQRAGVGFVFAGRRVVQDEWYVAARVASARVGTGGHGDGERRALEGHRWWTAADLASTDEVLRPPEIAGLVAAAAVSRAGGPPIRGYPRAMTDPALRDELLRLELAIARRDRAALAGGYAGVIDEAFRETGASGRPWTRAEILAALEADGPAEVAIQGFALEAIADGVALATFDTIGARRARRSSLWVRGTDGRWRLRFHQGTLVPDAPADR